jgi:hypothetical protein
VPFTSATGFALDRIRRPAQGTPAAPPLIQRAPAPPALPILFDFWTAAYQAIDD